MGRCALRLDGEQTTDRSCGVQVAFLRLKRVEELEHQNAKLTKVCCCPHSMWPQCGPHSFYRQAVVALAVPSANSISDGAVWPMQRRQTVCLGQGLAPHCTQHIAKHAAGQA